MCIRDRANGDPFSFDLNSGFVSQATRAPDFFSPEATLTVTLAQPVLLGDCNQDGVVDFEDVGPFIMILQSGSFLEEADCNEDGVVDFEDVGAFVAILQNI